MNAFNQIKMRALAKRYEAAKNEPNDSLVKYHYNAFIRECFEQFAQIPVKVIFTETDPYQTSAEMFSIVARRALDTETIGQVAVYFFGSKPKQYADQKAVLL